MRTHLLILLTVVPVACQTESETGIKVQVCGDLVVPDEIDSIRLTVYNEDRTEAWSGLAELQTMKQPEDPGDAGTGTMIPARADADPSGLPADPGVNEEWLGGPCQVDGDCGHARATCLTEDQGYPRGTCTLECTRTCPNRAETPAVFCIGGLELADGACVQQCDEAALPGNGCRPGYECVRRSRFDDESNQEDVCLPVPPVEPDAALADAGAPTDMGPTDMGVPDAMVPKGPKISLVRRVPNGRGSPWIRAQGLKDGFVVVVGEVRPSGSATLSLNRSCRSVHCSVGQTCVKGECELVPIGGKCQ